MLAFLQKAPSMSCNHFVDNALFPRMCLTLALGLAICLSLEEVTDISSESDVIKKRWSLISISGQLSSQIHMCAMCLPFVPIVDN